MSNNLRGIAIKVTEIVERLIKADDRERAALIRELEELQKVLEGHVAADAKSGEAWTRWLTHAREATTHTSGAAAISQCVRRITQTTNPASARVAILAAIAEAGEKGLTYVELAKRLAVEERYFYRVGGIWETRRLRGLTAPIGSHPKAWRLTEQGRKQLAEFEAFFARQFSILTPEEQHRAADTLQRAIGVKLPSNTSAAIQLSFATGVAATRFWRSGAGEISPVVAAMLEALDYAPGKSMGMADLGRQILVNPAMFPRYLAKQGLIQISEIGNRQLLSLTGIGQQVSTELSKLPAELTAVTDHHNVRVGMQDGKGGFLLLPLLPDVFSLPGEDVHDLAQLVAKLADHVKKDRPPWWSGMIAPD